MTIVIRVAMYPLTAKQLHATKAMQGIQPRVAELQKKYARDKQKLAQEQMKLYKESGISPAGCMIPMLIQMPIWIALYQSIMKVLPITPEDLLGLSRYLWSWPMVYSVLPLNSTFLWIDLIKPDIPVAIIVGATMWLQQKMVTPHTADPQQRAQSQMMLWMMPLMFGFLAMSFPSGLALYWVISNVISIVMQYFIMGGWGGLAGASAVVSSGAGGALKQRIAQVEKSPTRITATGADIVDPAAADEGETTTRRGGYFADISRVKHQPKRKHPKRG
jgi:YidC/Oxa1 family membrane protein insertase